MISFPGNIDADDQTEKRVLRRSKDVVRQVVAEEAETLPEALDSRQKDEQEKRALEMLRNRSAGVISIRRIRLSLPPIGRY